MKIYVNRFRKDKRNEGEEETFKLILSSGITPCRDAIICRLLLIAKRGGAARG